VILDQNLRQNQPTRMLKRLTRTLLQLVPTPTPTLACDGNVNTLAYTSLTLGNCHLQHPILECCFDLVCDDIIRKDKFTTKSAIPSLCHMIFVLCMFLFFLLLSFDLKRAILQSDFNVFGFHTWNFDPKLQLFIVLHRITRSPKWKLFSFFEN